MIRYFDNKDKCGSSSGNELINSHSRLAHSLANAALTKDNKMKVNIIQGVMRVGVRGRKCKY